MKIYTNTFDLRQPSEKKFWVAPYSDFKIGIKVIGNKPIQYGKAIWLSDGKKEITKDSEDNDFTYFKIKSGDTGEINYTITVIDGPNTLGYFTLTQVVTDSTVYEQESGGEIPSELTDITSITVGNGPYSTITNNKVKTETVEATDIVVNNNSAYINGCGAIKGTRLSIEDITLSDHNIMVQGDNGAYLNLRGGCGSQAYIEIQQDKIIRIQPNPSVSTYNTLVFKPYFMQELNGGCGGYVLAAFQ